MTPEQLDAIRERDAWYGPEIPLADRGSVSDRRIVLRLLDATTLTAAHLLAHQQARGIEKQRECDALEDLARSSMGASRKQSDAIAALRAENERLRVKIEHLHAQLYEEREAADRADAEAEDLLLHLEQLLEHAENPLGAEEWFALRDSCRAVIQQAKGGAP